MKAFEVTVNGKAHDYRVGRAIPLDDVQSFLGKKYKIIKIWTNNRHVLGFLEKGDKRYFFKLATSEGISAVTKNEFEWNDAFNKASLRRNSRYWVPMNVDSGLYNGLFYMITDAFEGEHIVGLPKPSVVDASLMHNIDDIIMCSEYIQSLDVTMHGDQNAQQYFLRKTKAWYDAVPQSVQEKYHMKRLLDVVEKGGLRLTKRPRHGDFTPWHMIRLPSGQLGLLDGEHAMGSGVEYYDIGYFIQRLYSVLIQPKLAEAVMKILRERNYDMDKLRVILAARTIGGFLDASLAQTPSYDMSERFASWVKSF